MSDYDKGYNDGQRDSSNNKPYDKTSRSKSEEYCLGYEVGFSLDDETQELYFN